jgi:hypothetical protein
MTSTPIFLDKFSDFIFSSIDQENPSSSSSSEAGNLLQSDDHAAEDSTNFKMEFISYLNHMQETLSSSKDFRQMIANKLFEFADNDESAYYLFSPAAALIRWTDRARHHRFRWDLNEIAHSSSFWSDFGFRNFLIDHHRVEAQPNDRESAEFQHLNSCADFENAGFVSISEFKCIFKLRAKSEIILVNHPILKFPL